MTRPLRVCCRRPRRRQRRLEFTNSPSYQFTNVCGLHLAESHLRPDETDLHLAESHTHPGETHLLLAECHLHLGGIDLRLEFYE